MTIGVAIIPSSLTKIQIKLGFVMPHMLKDNKNVYNVEKLVLKIK